MSSIWVTSTASTDGGNAREMSLAIAAEIKSGLLCLWPTKRPTASAPNLAAIKASSCRLIPQILTYMLRLCRELMDLVIPERGMEGLEVFQIILNQETTKSRI